MWQPYGNSVFCEHSPNERYYDGSHCVYESMEAFSSPSTSDSFGTKDCDFSPFSSSSNSDDSGTNLCDLNFDDVPNDFFDDFSNEDFVNGMINNINKEWTMKYDPINISAEKSRENENLVLPQNSNVEQYNERFFVGEENLPLLDSLNQRKIYNVENNCEDCSRESENISSEGEASDRYDGETKEKVLARCMKTLEILDDFSKFVGFQHIQQDSYESPLHRIPIIRFQFTSSPLRFQICSIFGALQELDIIEKSHSLFMSSDNICCLNCQESNAVQFYDKTTQCSEFKETIDVGTQVDIPLLDFCTTQTCTEEHPQKVSIGVQVDGCCQPFILTSYIEQKNKTESVARSFPSFEIKKRTPKRRLNFL